MSEVLRTRRKPSSSRWLARNMRDRYVAASKKSGYRSRAAYKIIEIDDKYNLLAPNMKVVDLGAAPGGWTQVIAKRIQGDSMGLWAIDLLKIEPIPHTGLTILQGDFNALKGSIPDKSIDVVASDMSPNFTGDHSTEHLRSMTLCESVHSFAQEKLKNNGSMVIKIIVGGGERELFDMIKATFKYTTYFKPKSSRSASSEMYIVAKAFIGS